MAQEGELNASLDPIPCVDCGEVLTLSVYMSGAGYYIGRFCGHCGPDSRESDYFSTRKAAEAELALWRKDNVRSSGRDTGFHG